MAWKGQGQGVGGQVSLGENLSVGGVGLRWPLSKVRGHNTDVFPKLTQVASGPRGSHVA